MKKGKRYQSKKKDNRITKHILAIIFVFAIVAGITYIVIKLYTNNNEKQDYENLANFMNTTTQNVDKDEVNSQRKSEKIINLEKLHNENNDIIGWIQIEGTNINYPVLQSDNSFYLNHNYKKEYSEIGSIFMDMNVNLELPSSNFLMYGHRTNAGMMFEDLLKYEDEKFYKNHKTIHFATLQEDAQYEILSVFRSRIYYQDEKNVFRYYYFTNAETEEEYNDYITNAKNVSLYDTGVNAKYGEQLITLSTCAYHTDNGRFVVVAKKAVD